MRIVMVGPRPRRLCGLRRRGCGGRAGPESVYSVASSPCASMVIRVHHFSPSVDRGLWGQTVQVLIDDEAVQIEQAEHLLVSYPCVYDTVRRRIATVNGQGRQQERPCQVLQLALLSVDLMRSV